MAMTAEPVFVPRPGQVDYTHLRYAPVLSAVVVCRGKVLLLQRSSGMRNHPNRWCGISGYLDDARCVEDKARQEMLEEAGITADRILTTRRGTVLLQEAPEYGKSWPVVPLLVHVRDRRYGLDWESQAAGWFSMSEALSLPLLPGVDAVITQYRDVIDRDRPPTRHGLSRCGGAAWGTEPQVVGAALAVFAVIGRQPLT